jgi:hypothetical protein
MFRVPSDVEKQAVWDAYRAGRPTRVPLTWGVNSRIILLNDELNPEGYTYEQSFHDPHVACVVQSRFQEYLATTLSQTCDLKAALPDQWAFAVENQNVKDAAYFGAEVVFEPGQVPITRTPYTLEDVDDFLARDFSKPLENPWLKNRLAMYDGMAREVERFTYLGRRGRLAPFGPIGFDGPVTALASLFGEDGFYLLRAEPEKARQVLMKIARDTATRELALARRSGNKPPERNWLADDSIQLLGVKMYRELVLPAHAWWYDTMEAEWVGRRPRSIHLCGDATRHFRTIRDELGVDSFDTGFPVDHGALRRELGPDVELLGGPRVDVLLGGTPDECAAAAREILRSGVTAGGRFILREANNLPPGCPLENLRAVYETCLEGGRYGDRG